MAGPSTLNPDQIAAARDGARATLEQLRHVVLGQEAALREVLLALMAQGHVLLEGPPGTAKTLLVRTLSLSLSLEFRRIQFTPDLMPSDVTGVNLLTGPGTFQFRPGPLFGDLVLGDEINRAPAKTQAALLEAMQERAVTVDGTTHPLSEAFTVFATQNPIEYEGTYPLPEAELDRFMVKVLIGYPDGAAEEGLLTRVLGGFEVQDPPSYGVRQVLDRAGLAQMRQAVRQVRVDPTLVRYITLLVRATRESPALTLGASPRASVALLHLAQASALLAGRDFAVPEDIKLLAPAAMRHRVAVAPELELEGVSADQALAQALERVEIPQ
ncbi:MAG TPA: MoxR family ATPase [Gemmatimonadales bacterium]|nr:MoxR family ATPase [Gemmatimonadales bacterium]